jgi:hypothetical protein
MLISMIFYRQIYPNTVNMTKTGVVAKIKLLFVKYLYFSAKGK